MAHNLTTIPSLRLALKMAKEVYMQPRFGASEQWLKVSKQEVGVLLINMADDTTPKDVGMSADIFGSMTNSRILYLG